MMTRPSKPTAIFLALALICISGPSAAAEPWLTVQAEIADPQIDPALEARIDALEHERDAIDPNQGRGGTIAGGVLLGVGALVGATIGIACAQANSGSDTTCRQEVATGIGIGAGAVALVGLTTLITSQSRLKRARRERKDLESKILDLRRERAALKVSQLGIGFMVGEHTGLVVGWRY